LGGWCGWVVWVVWAGDCVLAAWKG